MVPRHAPSPQFLRFLARVTRESFSSRYISPRKQQKRYFSGANRCLAKSSQRARSPRASKAKEEIGASWASTSFRNDDWRLQQESLKAFADVFTSRWVALDFREKVGMHPHPGLELPGKFLTVIFLDLLRHGWSPALIADWFSRKLEGAVSKRPFSEWLLNNGAGEHLKQLIDPSNMGQALYILGHQYIMSTSKVQGDLGEYMLKVAVLLNNRDAAMSVLISQYRRRSADEPSEQAFQILNSLADEGNDIGAMSLRAEMLMWPKKANTVPTAAQRSEARLLAQRAFEISEAGSPIPAPSPPRVSAPVACVPHVPTLPPWLLLQRMGGSDPRRLSADDLPSWERAVEAGAREYDDPGACELAISPSASIMPVGSVDWIKYATKAAMAGKGNAAFLLGQCYLELHRWYPSQPTLRKRDKIGFHWIEVSLSQTTFVPAIQERAFSMALLLRENGDVEAGKRWLEIGAGRVNEVAKTDGADTEGCAAALRFFKSCHEDWDLPLSQLPPDWKVDNYFPDRLLKDVV